MKSTKGYHATYKLVSYDDEENWQSVKNGSMLVNRNAYRTAQTNIEITKVLITPYDDD